MERLPLLILLATFISVALLVYGLYTCRQSRRELRERFSRPKKSQLPLVRREAKPSALRTRLLEFLTSFGRIALGKEKERGEVADLRTTLIQAGFRYPNAVAVFFGLKILGALLLPLLYLAYVAWVKKITTVNLGIALAAAALGYYLPNYLLRKILERRQDHIDRTLPDVLDLMIVSLEAGLSLPATLSHVAEEVRRLSRDFHQELRLTNAELRAGIPRERALKNLGERTGVQSVKSLVALMIQSEKMGASIAQSLRTHADFVRVQRAQRAEEMAAKMPIKIIFPTLFCIFPAIFVVILGPAAIQIYRTLIQR